MGSATSQRKKSTRPAQAARLTSYLTGLVCMRCGARYRSGLDGPGPRRGPEGRNPTASFKDRASAVGVARALARKARVVACASTGNAASSLAGAAASVGLRSIIFVPKTAPEPKVAQLLIFGARVIRVDGSYDETWELCQRACARHGWYNRNAAVNPSLV